MDRSRIPNTDCVAERALAAPARLLASGAVLACLAAFAVQPAASPSPGPGLGHAVEGRGNGEFGIAGGAVPHPFRLSVADAGITGPVLHARIRFFWDDLQLAVMEHTSDMEFELAENEEVDAIMEQYINDMLVITVGDAVLQGKVTARGIDEAALIDDVMWWYRLEYPLDQSVQRIHVRNRLLFNMFEDQVNILHMKTRRGRERAYDFNRGDDNVGVPLR